jgi:hypothetical protein
VQAIQRPSGENRPSLSSAAVDTLFQLDATEVRRGETLENRLKNGPLPLGEALEIAIQGADV